MQDKYYDSTSSLVMGILFLVLGVFLLIGQEQVYRYMVGVLVFVLSARAVLNLVRLTFRRIGKKKSKQTFISCLFHFGVALLFCWLPNLSLGIIPFFFAVYLLIIGISQFVMGFVEIYNGDFLRIGQFLVGIIYLVIAFPIFCSPVLNLATFLNCLSIYVLLLGISFLYDFLMQVLPVKTRNRLKRKIRITLPKFIEALIPYSVMSEINRNLAVKKSVQYRYEKNEKKSDLHILIHTSNRGVNRMGHIDVYFDGKVISYGNYDEGSRFCHDFFGDGVLFTASSKKDYINFCIDNSKKTVFDFGISLTDKQKAKVQERIGELFSNTVEWDHLQDKKYCDGNSYAAKLYRRTNAKFYKFKKGKYRTYFILGTNCCYLADDIIGKSGMDILSINGIITPGTYYDFLNRELTLKHSNVISKEVYNSSYRAK